MKRLPTASELPRASSCLYWLSDAAEHGPRTTSYFAACGSRVHAAIEAHIAGLPVVLDNANDDVLAIFNRWIEWASTHQDMVRGTPEMALAYSPLGNVARCLGRSLERDYSGAASTEFVGTADLIQFDEDLSTVTVTDWKCQFGPDSYSVPAEFNAQLHALGLFAGAYTGAQDVIVRRVLISDAGVDFDEHHMRAYELAATRERLADVAERLDLAVDLAPNPSGECAYCPARAACPALKPAMTAIVGSEPAKIDLTTPAGIALARAWAKRVDDARDELDARIKDAVRASGGHVPLPNGKHLRIVQATRSTIAWTDEQKARAIADGQQKTSTYDVLKETNK